MLMIYANSMRIATRQTPVGSTNAPAETSATTPLPAQPKPAETVKNGISCQLFGKRANKSENWHQSVSAACDT